MHATRVLITILYATVSITIFLSVPDLLICNLGPQKSIEENLKMVMHKELIDNRARETKTDASGITKKLRHCNK